MRHLGELDLPTLDAFDPAFAADPHEAFRRARNTGAWLARYQFGFVALDFESTNFFLRSKDCRPPYRDITKRWNAEHTPFARWFDNMLLGMSGEAHSRLRRIVAPAFTPREANRFRELMPIYLRETIADWLPLGRCDFAQGISRFPIGIICQLVGVSRKDIPTFERWLDKIELATAHDASALAVLNESVAAIFDYLDGVLQARRGATTKSEDLLQKLLDLTDEGGLTDEEVRCLLTVLLAAGYDTTKNQLTLIVYLMTQYPEYWRRAAIDPLFTKPLIEESLRYMNPIGAQHRVANVDIEYRNVLIPANTFISLSPNCSGRDPAINADPDRFDPNRTKPVHCAFGVGEHFCLGVYIARALLEEAVPILARAILEPRLDGIPTFRSPLAVWGLATLPILYTPGVL